MSRRNLGHLLDESILKGSKRNELIFIPLQFGFFGYRMEYHSHKNVMNIFSKQIPLLCLLFQSSLSSSCLCKPNHSSSFSLCRMIFSFSTNMHLGVIILQANLFFALVHLMFCSEHLIMLPCPHTQELLIMHVDLEDQRATANFA